MALMLRQEGGRALLLGWAPPSQVLQTPEQTCLPGAAAPGWDRARCQGFREGLKGFLAITACSFITGPSAKGRERSPDAAGRLGQDIGTYETYAG